MKSLEDRAEKEKVLKANKKLISLIVSGWMHDMRLLQRPFR